MKERTLLPVNLSFFGEGADEQEQAVTPPAPEAKPPTAETKPPAAPPPAKTFTEAEYNAQAEALASAQITAAEAQAEVAKYKQAEAVRKAGVTEKFVGYVGFEAGQVAIAENIDFDAALKKFLEANKEYTPADADPPPNPRTHTIKLDTGGNKSDPPQENLFDFSYLANF